MKQSKAKTDLLKRFADNQEEDEIFGDVESIDFSSNRQKQQSQQQQQQQQQQRHGENKDTNNDDADGLETLRINQLHINNLLPLFQLTPKNELTSSSSPQHTRSSKSSGGRTNNATRNSNSSAAKRITRDALSEYSEENDTDITSELSQDEFEGWDECFSKNQSIYQQMNQRLIAKKVAQQQEAERELRDLLEHKNNRSIGIKDDPNQTLKLRDGIVTNGAGGHKLTSTNLGMLDHLENEKTINYDFTRDDYEEFEDGFEGDFEESIQKIKQHQQHQQQQTQKHRSRDSGDTARQSLLNKQSMPSLAKNQTNTLKKFKSTMDLTGDTLHEQQYQPPPSFNFDNRVINKLDRIPSFYNKPRIPDPESRIQLLDKYAERKDKDGATAKSHPRKDNGRDIHTSGGYHQNHRHHHHRPHAHPKMGHIRYFHDGEGKGKVGDYIIPRSKSMVFNKAQNRWEGNEVDLLRFEQKPSLITLKEIEPPVTISHNHDGAFDKDADAADGDFAGKKRQGNMLYDDVNLKWINLDQDDEYIFDDIPDLIEPLETIRQHHEQQQQQQQQQQRRIDQYSPTRPRLGGTNVGTKGATNTIYVLQSPISRRGLSQFTQRTTSSTTSIQPIQQQLQLHPSISRSRSTLLQSQPHQQQQQQQQQQTVNDNGSLFIPPLSQKLIDKFTKEEAKINRKIGHWFIDDNNDVKLDYYWEIRKLIMED